MTRPFTRGEVVLVSAISIAGLALRLRQALITYLNPDEAWHALISFGNWEEALRGSLNLTHPPLLIVITHLVSLVSRAELVLRLAPVLAGTLFPLLLFLWLRNVAGKMAAMTGLFLLTLSPHLVTVSAQLRSYTLALLWLSVSLVVLEKALDTNSWPTMAAYSFLLWMCILSDYSMAWFVGGVGVYAWLRLRGASARLKATWAAGQLLALALYGLLVVIQIRNFRSGTTEHTAVSGWLRGAFPQPGRMQVFPFANTLKQFAYLMASVPLGVLAMILFGVAVYWLWTGRTAIERNRARAMAVLLVVPFLLALAGAYAHQFPYGRTRHTLVIGLFGATGIAIFVETLPRRAAIAILSGALMLTPLWHWRADQDGGDIRPDRNRRALMLQGLDYMQSAIPPGSVIFTDHATLLILAYYEGHHEPPKRLPGQFSETFLGGRWRAAAVDEGYTTPDAYRAALAAFRRHYGLGEDRPVWVLEGGWDDLVSGQADQKRPFTRTIRVFQAGCPSSGDRVGSGCASPGPAAF